MLWLCFPSCGMFHLSLRSRTNKKHAKKKPQLLGCRWKEEHEPSCPGNFSLLTERRWRWVLVDSSRVCVCVFALQNWSNFTLPACLPACHRSLQGRVCVKISHPNYPPDDGRQRGVDDGGRVLVPVPVSWFHWLVTIYCKAVRTLW